MKHPRDDERIKSSIELLGSDHREMKRQRIMSEGSEISSTENRSCYSNIPANTNNSSCNPKKKIINNAMAGIESSTMSPKMMALLSSLEVLDDNKQRQIKQQWPLGPTKASIPVIPNPFSIPPNQAVSTFLRQKHGQPLIARPAIEKIEERPPVQVSTSATAKVESRDAPDYSSLVDNVAMNTIESVAAAAAAATATATTGTTFETAVNAALAQHRIATSAASAFSTVTSDGGVSFLRSPAVASTAIGTQNLPRAPFKFPTFAGATTSNALSVKYGISNLNHRKTLMQSAREIAIHNAVHNDYKKIYKPLKRPPRLPTAHEALIIAAISTAST